MKELNLLLDAQYDLNEIGFSGENEATLLKVKLVGIFEMKDQADLYWSRGKFGELDDAIVMDEALLYDVVKLHEKSG